MDVWVLHWVATEKPGGGVLRVYADEELATEAWSVIHDLFDDREIFLDKFEVTK